MRIDTLLRGRLPLSCYLVGALVQLDDVPGGDVLLRVLLVGRRNADLEQDQSRCRSLPVQERFRNFPSVAINMQTLIGY